MGCARGRSEKTRRGENGKVLKLGGATTRTRISIALPIHSVDRTLQEMVDGAHLTSEIRLTEIRKMGYTLMRLEDGVSVCRDVGNGRRARFRI